MFQIQQNKPLCSCLSFHCSRTKQETVSNVRAGYADYSNVESDYDDLNMLELTPELQTNAVTETEMEFVVLANKNNH